MLNPTAHCRSRSILQGPGEYKQDKPEMVRKWRVLFSFREKCERGDAISILQKRDKCSAKFFSNCKLECGHEARRRLWKGSGEEQALAGNPSAHWFPRNPLRGSKGKCSPLRERSRRSGWEILSVSAEGTGAQGPRFKPRCL